MFLYYITRSPTQPVIPYRTQREPEQQNQVENPLNLYGLAGKNKMLFDIIRFIYLNASAVHIQASPSSSTTASYQPQSYA